MTEETDGIRRAANGRPYIWLPDGSKEVQYTRTSTFAKALSDGDALSSWKLGTMVKGLMVSPGLLNMVLKPLAELEGDIDHEDLKPAIKSVIALSMDAGGANDAANWGTTLHHFADIIDFTDEPLNRDMWDLSPQLWDALDAYVELTAEMKMLTGEQFVVNDELKVAGSYDRTAIWRGRVVVCDLKTGAVRMPDHAAQTALYSRSKGYNKQTGERIEGPIDTVDQSVGLIVHLPRPGVKDSRGKQVEPSIIPVDLEAGWKCALLAEEVRQARRGKYALPIEEESNG